MYSRAEIRRMVKNDAKKALIGNRLQAIIIFLIIIIASVGVSSLFGRLGSTFGGGLLGMIINIAVVSPLILGATCWYLTMLRGNKPDFASVFDWFTSKKQFISAILTHGFFVLSYFAITIGAAIIGIIVMVIAFFTGILPQAGKIIDMMDNYYNGQVFFYNQMSPYMMQRIMPLIGAFCIFMVIIIALMIAAYIFMIRFMAIYNITADDPKKDISMVLYESRLVMKKHTLDMVIFYLSFFGWYLLIPITFGLISLYLAPYMMASKVLYIEYFRDTYKAEKDQEEVKN